MKTGEVLAKMFPETLSDGLLNFTGTAEHLKQLKSHYHTQKILAAFLQFKYLLILKTELEAWMLSHQPDSGVRPKSVCPR